MENNIYATGIRLWKEWTEMWNGRPELALELAAARFNLHLVTPSDQDQLAIASPEALRQWVARHCAKYQSIRFVFSVGPFVDERAGVVSGPWHAEIMTREGKPVWACGMDTVMFRDGKITDYWTVSKPADEIGRWSTR
jgi:hypothetical protein